MAKKRKINPLIAEYNKERRRLQQFVRRAEKRGYHFNKSPIPAKPKKITQASVNRLKKLTPDQLYKKSVYMTDNPNEPILTGVEARKRELKQASIKAAETRRRNRRIEKPNPTLSPISDLILNTLEEFLNGFDPRPDYTFKRKQSVFQFGSNSVNRLKILLQNTINNAGRKGIENLINTKTQQHYNELRQQETNENLSDAELLEIARSLAEADTVTDVYTLGRQLVAQRLNKEITASKISDIINKLTNTYGGEAEAAFSELATIIKGSTVTNDEWAGIEAQADSFSNWQE